MKMCQLPTRTQTIATREDRNKCSSEIVVTIYQIILCHNLEEQNIQGVLV